MTTTTTKTTTTMPTTTTTTATLATGAAPLARRALLASAVLAGLLTGCATDEAPAPDMDEPTAPTAQDTVALNKDLLHRYHVDVWDEGHLENAWQYMAPTFTSHATVTTMPAGQQVGADFLAQFRIGFPDLRSHEDALIGDGDLVTLRWTITGTHTGTFFGVAPTGRSIQVSGMDILRVADGKLVEHWGGVGDQMDDFFAQIGALPR